MDRTVVPFGQSPRVELVPAAQGISRLDVTDGRRLRLVPHLMILTRYLVLILFLAAYALYAHPNYNATHKVDVTPVPATEKPPGDNQVSITIEGSQRVITANGLPDHLTGRFPNADNPNSIKPQRYRYTMPAQPVANAKATALLRQPFGI